MNRRPYIGQAWVLRATAFRALAAVALALLLPAGLVAAEGDGERGTAARLPVTRVVLFSSGVGYFEHNGRVTGDALLEMEFREAEINDLLKSLVLRDFDGGLIHSVTYTSRDPLARTLQSFAVDLTHNPGLGGILLQTRGEPVEIVAPSASAEPLRGTVIGVEEREAEQAAGPGEPLKVQQLNLLTDRGLQSVRLDKISELRFLSPRLNEELRQALDLLAQGQRNDRKQVRLHFNGSGSRRVQVAYVREAPVWKTSYRLSVPREGDPYLQGWAILENTTDQDWTDVRLSLVAGRPISFIMELYPSIYLPRPRVAMELYGGLTPRTHEDDLSAAGAAAELSEAAPRLRAPAPPSAARRSEPQFSLEKAAPGAGVQAAAEADRAGEFFQYRIVHPVTVRRRESAMLPIVTQTVEAQRVSVYNAQVQSSRPYNGLRLKNTTGLGLMGGPLTVFEEGTYAGDARVDYLPAGGERLITYSLDLETEVAAETGSSPERLVGVRLDAGALITTTRLRRETTYTVRHQGERARTLLIEHAVQPDWELVEPRSPTEKTRSLYRFELPLAPRQESGARRQLTVAEERSLVQSVALTNLPEDRIEIYLQARQVSAGVKAALRQLQEIRSDLTDLQRRRKQEEARIAELHREQARIRDNMARLERDSALYRRYVGILDQQENELEALKQLIDRLQQSERIRQSELDSFLRSLKLE